MFFRADSCHAGSSLNEACNSYDSETLTSKASAAVDADLRGMWWNPYTKTVQGNLFNGAGYVTVNTDSTTGLLTDDVVFITSVRTVCQPAFLYGVGF